VDRAGPAHRTQDRRLTRLVRRPPVLLAAVILGLLVGTGTDVLRVGGLDTWLARHRVSPTYDARGRTVAIDGRDVYLDCRGAGRRTVILEAGFGSGAASWGYVLDAVAGFARVCAWDRPGIGRSDARGLHSAGESMADLRAVLDAAGEQPPFILVAHSLGGVYARIFATANPGDVEATLMIDTYEPDLGLVDDPGLPAATREVIRRNLVETGAMIAAGEELDWARTLSELAATRPALHVSHVLSVDQRLRYTSPDPALQGAMIRAWEAAVRSLYPNAEIEIVPGAGHLIHLDRPDLVIARIRALVPPT
jgi:pimeloyl-ACP methyl ester carboxylesterase